MKIKPFLTVGISTLAIVATTVFAGSVEAADSSSKPVPTPGPNYTASRFPGVKVRHVPGPARTASQTRSMAAKRKGMVINNVRRISGTKAGYMADVDADFNLRSGAAKTSSPQSHGKREQVVKSNSLKTAHHKP